MFHYLLWQSTAALISPDTESTHNGGRNDYDHIIFMNSNPHISSFATRANKANATGQEN